MRTPAEAITSILEHTAPRGEREHVPLLQAFGRVLAEDVVSDVDMPPFRKSAMDGFAVQRADFEGADKAAGVRLGVVGESRAGHPFAGEVPRGSALAIYTGAEVPRGCDAVVMVEKSESEQDSVLLRDAPRPNQNICEKGEDLHIGGVVARAGRLLTATDMSILASVGCEPVPVMCKPRVAILTTGDELVPPDQIPAHGQIREGNTLHLAALVQRAGGEVLHVGLVPDDPGVLLSKFAEALEGCEVVITTGGVSMGKYDLVAEAFQSCGVEEIFHKVAIKPGKPLWFGKRGKTLVFGLPGNPVSCLLDHEVFVRPALRKLAGLSSDRWVEPLRRGRWMGERTRDYPREQNLAARIEQAADGVDELMPLDWTSSADIVGLASAQAFVVIPAGESRDKGELTGYRSLF